MTVGQAVKVDITSAGEDQQFRNIQGTINQILPSANPQSRQFEAKIVMDNPDNRFKSGMFARVRLASATDSTLLVDAGAIHRLGQLEGVFCCRRYG